MERDRDRVLRRANEDDLDVVVVPSVPTNWPTYSRTRRSPRISACIMRCWGSSSSVMSED